MYMLLGKVTNKVAHSYVVEASDDEWANYNQKALDGGGPSVFGENIV
jgi:hypothetical protein